MWRPRGGKLRPNTVHGPRKGRLYCPPRAESLNPRNWLTAKAAFVRRAESERRQVRRLSATAARCLKCVKFEGGGGGGAFFKLQTPGGLGKPTRSRGHPGAALFLTSPAPNTFLSRLRNNALATSSRRRLIDASVGSRSRLWRAPHVLIWQRGGSHLSGDRPCFCKCGDRFGFLHVARPGAPAAQRCTLHVSGPLHKVPAMATYALLRNRHTRIQNR